MIMPESHNLLTSAVAAHNLRRSVLNDAMGVFGRQAADHSPHRRGPTRWARVGPHDGTLHDPFVFTRVLVVQPSGLWLRNRMPLFMIQTSLTTGLSAQGTPEA
jgi:hypothetical protein